MTLSAGGVGLTFAPLPVLVVLLAVAVLAMAVAVWTLRSLPGPERAEQIGRWLYALRGQPPATPTDGSSKSRDPKTG